jgi:NTE family protein
VDLLRNEGRRAASEFLEATADDLGKRSIADLDVLLAEC